MMIIMICRWLERFFYFHQALCLIACFVSDDLFIDVGAFFLYIIWFSWVLTVSGHLYLALQEVEREQSFHTFGVRVGRAVHCLGMP